jgi:predicted TIM-barrel fold metal-dependent hydrolase
MGRRPLLVGKFADIGRETIVYHSGWRSDSMDTNDRRKAVCRDDCSLAQKECHRGARGASAQETSSAGGKQTRLDRRGFLSQASFTGGLAAAAQALSAAGGDTGQDRPLAELQAIFADWEAPAEIVDVNVYLGPWPFRSLEGEQADRLVGRLKGYGVVQAWAGSFEALLHRDLRGVNARLVQWCRAVGNSFLLPMGVVNPKLPDWEEDLRQIVEEYGLPGIRLHPDYHQYSLDDPDFVRLLTLASRHGLVVQLVLMIEDERTVHPAVKVPMVDPRPLAAVVSQIRGLKLVLLNAQRVTPLPLLAQIAQAGQVFVDISWQEGVGGVENLLSRLPWQQVVFGSYSPRFYFASALLKLRESDLRGQPLRAIACENARTLLKQKL